MVPRTIHPFEEPPAGATPPFRRARFDPKLDDWLIIRALLSSLDIGLLSIRDRACLRLLYRAGVATADQLTTLIFPSRRTALRRLHFGSKAVLSSVIRIHPLCS